MTYDFTLPDENVLYAEGKVKIRYHPTSVEDHVLGIGGMQFVLQRGILEQLARDPFEDLIKTLGMIDERILNSAVQERIEFPVLYAGLRAAYAEEERRIAKSMTE